MSRPLIPLVIALLLAPGILAQETQGKPAQTPSVDELIASFNKEMNEIRPR